MPDTRTQFAFSAEPEGQAARALQLLSRLPGVSALAAGERRVSVSYSSATHSFAELEAWLLDNGLVLASGPLQLLGRALARYADDVERDNLNVPEHNVKARDIYVQAWGHHPHGDSDETPEELRRYL
ncbi:hypothetical protein [Jeongeupia sp. USM3]|uniref:hypothetical protein n=1 Tax=Jeongeupia sp. USM3 TaxID=1906741 RepID=UPI00089DD6BF|nr:hypothetical protein [Jeongeupia sp. USM3]AOY00368.1 hypothetical protein BJP62_07865 [Jeongeupia sp. USM3]